MNNRLNELTKREREVLGYMYTSMSYQEIALLISINEKTIKYHATFIFKKLGVRSRIDLLARALKEAKEAALIYDMPPPEKPEIFDLDALPRGNR